MSHGGYQFADRGETLGMLDLHLGAFLFAEILGNGDDSLELPSRVSQRRKSQVSHYRFAAFLPELHFPRIPRPAVFQIVLEP